MTKIKKRSRRRSYGKKVSHRQLTQRKQRAIETARVREVEEVEVVENVTPTETATKKPTETKIPWRAPRSKPDPSTNAVGTVFCGCLGIILLPFAILSFEISTLVGLWWLIFPITFILAAIHNFRNSRGGW